MEQFKINESLEESEIADINDRISEIRHTTAISDGYHTFGELYRYRALYNAGFFNLLHKYGVKVIKSRRHFEGDNCFGGDYFIVQAMLPTGQVTNHYQLDLWDLFKIPEQDRAYRWDGHTPAEAADRLEKYIQEWL